jgi:hypothetical protein
LPDYISGNVIEPTPEPGDCCFVAQEGVPMRSFDISDDLLFGAAVAFVIAVVLAMF